MRLEKWFISNLDDSQRQIIVRDPNENLIVQGSAGSGKTNLAIHRAVQASAFSDSYALVVYTKALKRMVAYGLDAMGLDRERIAYDWAWANRGFDLFGDVYCERSLLTPNANTDLYTIKNKKVYVLKRHDKGNYLLEMPDTDQSCAFFLNPASISEETLNIHSLYSKINSAQLKLRQSGENLTLEIFKKLPKYKVIDQAIYLVQKGVMRKFVNVGTDLDVVKTNNEGAIFGLDYESWEDQAVYNAFGRRMSWFIEETDFVPVSLESDSMKLIPSGTLFRIVDKRIDYVIIDEAQDFGVDEYERRFIPQAVKSVTLFGDSSQKIYSNRGASMDSIAARLKFRRLFLKYNYRLPKSIARMAQNIPIPSVDLLSDNMKDGGDSDYPNYPKPIISKFDNREKELEYIVEKIDMEDLDDVAILVPTEEDVRYVHEFFTKRGIGTQVHFRTGKEVPYLTINTLDFTNTDLPCILTYHAAKGTEFDNVFIPFANNEDLIDNNRNAFYVACTRSSHSLYISFSSEKLTKFLSKIDRQTVVERNVKQHNWINA